MSVKSINVVPIGAFESGDPKREQTTIYPIKAEKDRLDALWRSLGYPNRNRFFDALIQSVLKVNGA